MAHNWSMASSGAGIGPHVMAAVAAGLVITVGIGFMFRAKNAA